MEGRVRSVFVREGETVKRGQVLAMLAPDMLAQSVAEPEARLSSAEARLYLARTTLDKQGALFQKGFIDQVVYEEYHSDCQIKVVAVKAQSIQLARMCRLLAGEQDPLAHRRCPICAKNQSRGISGQTRLAVRNRRPGDTGARCHLAHEVNS